MLTDFFLLIYDRLSYIVGGQIFPLMGLVKHVYSLVGYIQQEAEFIKS